MHGRRLISEKTHRARLVQIKLQSSSQHERVIRLIFYKCMLLILLWTKYPYMCLFYFVTIFWHNSNFCWKTSSSKTHHSLASAHSDRPPFNQPLLLHHTFKETVHQKFKFCHHLHSCHSKPVWNHRHPSKYLVLCPAEVSRSYKLGTTWCLFISGYFSPAVLQIQSIFSFHMLFLEYYILGK